MTLTRRHFIGGATAVVLAIISAGFWHGLTGIPASYFGMNVSVPQSNEPTGLSFGTQRLWNTTDVGDTVDTAWGYVETSNGVYDWTLTDAVVAIAQSKAPNIIYTLGYVPTWASGLTMADPPTDLNSSGSAYFNAFVTALVNRYKGKIKIYELWNEPNGATYWTGTVTQNFQMVTPAYAIIKSVDPNAIVLCPSSYSSTVWLQSFLILGGGAYCDGFAYHAYPWVNGDPPEAFSYIPNYVSYAMKAYGFTKPLWNTEFNNQNAAPAIPVNLAVYYILGWPNGFVSNTWFDYDGAGSGALESGGVLNASGVAYGVVEGWLNAAVWTSNPARQAGSNGIRNTTWTGAVAGTQGACSSTTLGTLPTNTNVFMPAGARGTNGVYWSVAGTGTVGSVTYLDFRVCSSGNPTGSSNVEFYLETPNHIAVTLNSWWSNNLNLSVSAGATTNVTIRGYTEETDSGGSQLAFDGGQTFYPTSYGVDKQTWWWNTTQLTNALVAFTRPMMEILYTSGNAFDVTLRMAIPNTDSGTIWQGDFTRLGGSKARVAWDVNGGPTSYSTSTACNSGACTTYTGIDGVSHNIVSNSVSLTNSPVMLQ
jgi:hypothetical protein